MTEHDGSGEIAEENILELRVEELWRKSLSDLKMHNDLPRSQACLNILKAIRPYVNHHVYMTLHDDFIEAQRYTPNNGGSECLRK